MLFQSYRECFILLNHVPCIGCRVYTVSKRRRKERKKKTHMPFFSESNSTVEWGAEYWGSSTQPEWRFKEMEGTRNSLLQPPPHGILRVGRRRTKKQKQNKNQKYTDVLVLYQLSLGHLPPTFQDLSPTQPGSHGFCNPGPWQL